MLFSAGSCLLRLVVSMESPSCTAWCTQPSVTEPTSVYQKRIKLFMLLCENMHMWLMYVVAGAVLHSQT